METGCGCSREASPRPEAPRGPSPAGPSLCLRPQTSVLQLRAITVWPLVTAFTEFMRLCSLICRVGVGDLGLRTGG